MIGNFTEVKPLRYWVQHILPLVYDDSLSYMELLGKVINTLNEVVKNNNLLPDYIMGLIKEYISSGEIEKVLADVLANYMLNVKFPPAGLKPATGDGSADDTEAIQGCIDYAYNNGGMSVYFPSGSYLTQPLTLRDKATLFGQDRYTTRLVMKGGATTAMFTGDVDELTLTGLGFDGNMDIQVNNVNLFTISVNSAIITNCLLTDGYDLLNITVNDDLQLNDVIFRHAVENALVLKGAGIVQGNNLIFKSVSTLVGKNFVVMDVSKSILEQLKCYGASPNAVLINGSNNVVKMWNEQSLKAYTDNGVNNTVEVYTQSEQKKLTGFKTTNIGGDLTETVGGNKTETITGNKDVNVHDLTETVAGNHTKAVAGDISESARNFKTVIQLAYNLTANSLTEQLISKEVNATNSTENLDNKTEIITGEKDVTANNSTENISNEKHVIAGSVTEDITEDKHVTAANSIETISGDKTVNAGDITETSANKTIHTTKDYTAQIDGNRNVTVNGSDTETTKNKTVNIDGNLTEAITGNNNLSSNNSTETVTNSKVVNSNVFNENVTETKTTNAKNITETVTNTKTINAKDIIVNSANPVTYKTPTELDENFNYIPLKDSLGNEYKVLVYNGEPLKIKTPRRCIFISDSYGDRENSWIDYAVQFMGLTVGNWYKSALSGAGFKPTYNSYFITLLRNIENNVTDKDTISDIIVGGGFNDRVTAVSEIQTAINEFCTYCKTTYPNAKIWIGAFGWSFNYEFLNELRNGRYIQAYKTCGLYGANYLSGSDFIMHSTANFEPEGKGGYTLYLDYQYVHPNDRGAQLIAACVMNNLNGAPFHYYEKLDPINIEPNTTDGVSFQSSKNVNEIINDNLISYWLDSNLNIHWSTPKTSSGTDFLEIGSIKTGAIAGVALQNASPMGFMALGFIAGGTTTKNTEIPVYVMIANSRIYVQLSADNITFDTLFLLNVRGEINNIFA